LNLMGAGLRVYIFCGSFDEPLEEGNLTAGHRYTMK